MSQEFSKVRIKSGKLDIVSHQEQNLCVPVHGQADCRDPQVLFYYELCLILL